MTKFFKEYGLLYVLGLVAFFALIRYRGYDSDAALYLLQVMNYLQPERFVNDVPFMFGNQDSFSIFSPIVAVALKLLGVNMGGIVVTLVMLFLLCSAFVTLVCKWTKFFNAREWCLPVVLVTFFLLCDKEYGSGCLYLPIFESYLVARVFSEIFIVTGLAFLFDKNKIVSLVFFLLASFMHPLMGGWTLPLWLFFHFPKFRMPILFLAVLAPLSGFLHMGRLDFYPDDWKPLYMKPEWVEFAMYTGLLAYWLAMYRHFKDGTLSKFSINLFWVSLIGFYLHFVGSYAEHQLFYQAQPFRVQWLCTIPVIPVFAFFVRDVLKNGRKFTLCDYSGLVLGLCAIANYHWFLIIIVCLTLIFTSIGKIDKLALSISWTRFLFVGGLAFLLVNSVVCNYIQLAIEQGIGNTNLAVSWMHLPAVLSIIEHFLLVLLALVCVYQKKYGYALIFAVAFCNANMKILPIVGLLLCLLPSLNFWVKKSLLALALSFSFFEILSSMHKINSTNTLPLEGSVLACIVLFVVLLVVAFRILSLKRIVNCSDAVAPLIALVVSLGVWDVFKWDSRDGLIIENEKQMDAFFDEPIFPQVKNRGKILFVVDYESPIQSRINFMTGAYADESIYVGEIFYKNQFVESNRRRNALLTGRREMGDIRNFKEKMVNVYVNSDTLLARVIFLCGTNEIMYFATDCANMPLPKEDSVFLDVKKKYVWLYGCP